MVTLATRPLLSGFLFCMLRLVHILKIMIQVYRNRRPRHHSNHICHIFTSGENNLVLGTQILKRLDTRSRYWTKMYNTFESDVTMHTCWKCFPLIVAVFIDNTSMQLWIFICWWKCHLDHFQSNAKNVRLTKSKWITDLEAVKHINNNVYCWLDSLTAIYWIFQENKEWKPFVQNCVTEIGRLVAPQFWFHCPTKGNVAVIAWRGATPSELLGETRWWKGPKVVEGSNLAIDAQERMAKPSVLLKRLWARWRSRRNVVRRIKLWST